MDNIKNFKLDTLFTPSDKMEPEFFPIITDDDPANIDSFSFPEYLPILPLRNMVVFPGVVIPINIGRQSSLKLIKEAFSSDKIIGTLAQRDGAVENPTESDLHQTGTVATILKILEMPDGSTTVIIQGKRRFNALRFVSTEPYFAAQVEALSEAMPQVTDAREFEAIVGSIRDLATRIVKMSPSIPDEAVFAIKNIDNPFFLVNFICANSELKVEVKQDLLTQDNLFKRSIKLLEYLSKELQMLELKVDIQQKVKADLDKQQREFLLNQQIKTIQD